MISNDITLPYGTDSLQATLQGFDFLGTLDVKNAPPLIDPAYALLIGMEHPIGQSSPFVNTLNPGETVCIVVSDSFRYTGVELLLPELLRILNAAGINDGDISFLYATGSHRAPTEAEAQKILGAEIYDRFKDRAFSHDPAIQENMIHLGKTRRGTPVEINRRALQCDRLIVTGTVVYHYFGGFGGGRKSILPGIASLKSIAHNHALNIHPTENKRNPKVKIGSISGNPVAEDMLEGAKLCKVDLLINTVLNREGKIAGLFVGDMDTAHREAANFATSLYACPISQKVDLLIASAGTAKNFIQSHKALFNAHEAMKPGGRIIFAAAAPEGLGGDRFRHWLGLGTVEAVFKELRIQAEINGQTALSVLEKAPSTFLITAMPNDDAARIGAQICASLTDALNRAKLTFLEKGNNNPTVYLMPSASYTVPIFLKNV